MIEGQELPWEKAKETPEALLASLGIDASRIDPVKSAQWERDHADRVLSGFLDGADIPSELAKAALARVGADLADQTRHLHRNGILLVAIVADHSREAAAGLLIGERRGRRLAADEYVSAVLSKIPEEQSKARTWERWGLLWLDVIGAERPGASQIVDALIRRRCDEGLTTVITPLASAWGKGFGQRYPVAAEMFRQRAAVKVPVGKGAKQ
jgi:hypothetical protein